MSASHVPGPNRPARGMTARVANGSSKSDWISSSNGNRVRDAGLRFRYSANCGIRTYVDRR
jgi:hypothetical protein